MNDVQDIGILSDKLISYLRTKLGNPAIGFASPLTRLQGGYETSTYRFELDPASNELSRPLVLRLYPQFYGTRSAIWESTVQDILAGEGYPAARVHVVCTDMSILGGAFFIMDHLSGRPLAAAPPDSVPGLLGQTHAELHNIDPDLLLEALKEKGVDEDGYRLESRFDWLRGRARELPWLLQAIDWLLDHRPLEECQQVAQARRENETNSFEILYGTPTHAAWALSQLGDLSGVPVLAELLDSELALWVGDLCRKLGRQQDATDVYERVADEELLAGRHARAIAILKRVLESVAPQRADLRLKLEAMGISIDTLTAEQEKYLNQWQVGT